MALQIMSLWSLLGFQWQRNTDLPHSVCRSIATSQHVCLICTVKILRQLEIIRPIKGEEREKIGLSSLFFCLFLPSSFPAIVCSSKPFVQQDDRFIAPKGGRFVPNRTAMKLGLSNSDPSSTRVEPCGTRLKYCGIEVLRGRAIPPLHTDRRQVRRPGVCECQEADTIEGG